ncbi:PREDICTED: annexin A5-like [Priapulus caudatus]|uniref:Annexin A5-like n=1 Tax=Priapulus caudatus TaxID=37621 RepID=A0ABM1F5A4_PRICU|nr:PREDICTED: annexin A5-like [Priapulus caudatus]
MKVGQDCNELHKALKYNKLKEFVRLLIHRNKDQRQDLQKTYQQKFEQDLKQEVKSHFSGSARDAIIGLLMSSVEYDAFWLHNSMSGGATHEATLIEILATRDMQALRDIKENYRWEYNSDLEGDIAKQRKGTCSV